MMCVGKRQLNRAHGAVNHWANQRFQGAASEFVDEEGAVRQRETQRGGIGFRELMLDSD